jgi:cob(I)alamin adenosyltransferase
MSDEWKIYTRTGDKGETSLIGGRRVPKYHLQIEAYGTADELNSFIGLIRDESTDIATRTTLLEIQDRLFTLESLLAEDKIPDPGRIHKHKPLPHLEEADVDLLEHEIDRMNESLPQLTSFILPGGHRLGSLCHVARTICRRAERVTLLLAQELEVNPLVIKYINRLSDYLFVLARFLVLQNGGVEILWKARV